MIKLIRNEFRRITTVREYRGVCQLEQQIIIAKELLHQTMKNLNPSMSFSEVYVCDKFREKVRNKIDEIDDCFRGLSEMHDELSLYLETFKESTH